MKSVLMSIKPKYCELIALSKKTIEVRKTKPKIHTPFKCYIYCTLPKERFSIGQGNYACNDNLYLCDGRVKFGEGFEDIISLNGKVIGEFVCDKIDEIHISTELMYEKEVTGFSERTLNILNQSCLSYDEIIKYSGFTLDNYNAQKEYLYGWHISNLVIYDEPKELSEFMIIDKNKLSRCPYRERICQNPEYCNGNYLLGGYSCSKVKEPDFEEIDFCRCGCSEVFKSLTHPPQSWCYVEV